LTLTKFPFSSTISRPGQLASCLQWQTYLCRLFKRYADETPLHRPTRLRTPRAADLLSGGGVLVKQAAEAVGYPDPYHFSRVFKRAFGIAPEAFTQAARRLT
jgi:AraC-like DNA-binding protein